MRKYSFALYLLFSSFTAFSQKIDAKSIEGVYVYDTLFVDYEKLVKDFPLIKEIEIESPLRKEGLLQYYFIEPFDTLFTNDYYTIYQDGGLIKNKSNHITKGKWKIKDTNFIDFNFETIIDVAKINHNYLYLRSKQISELDIPFSMTVRYIKKEAI